MCRGNGGNVKARQSLTNVTLLLMKQKLSAINYSKNNGGIHCAETADSPTIPTAVLEHS